LTEEEKARLDELKKKQAELSRKYSKLYQELGAKGKDDAELKKLGAEMGALYPEIAKLEPRSTPRGSVWLYLRKK